MSDPYQPQDPYAQNPYGEQPAPPVGYGYPPQDPYAQPDPYAQQQQGYGYPQQPGYGGYNNYGGPGVPGQQKNGLAIASLVVGIISIVGFCFLGWLTGMAAIGLGIAGLNKSKTIGTGRSQAIGGIVTGAVGLLIAVVLVIVVVTSSSFNGVGTY